MEPRERMRRRWEAFRQSPLIFYMSARLHRRIFSWFGASILFSGLTFLALSKLWQWLGHGRPIVIPLLIASAILWGASGRIAWNLSRPYVEMTRVAQELGAGKLSSRIPVSRRQALETRILAVTLNEMAERIEKQMKDQRELLAAVSHEMRTPLARLRVLTELARGGGAQGKVMDDIDREVVEMDGLVGELLANSRLDFAALSLTPLFAEEMAARALERAGLPATLLVRESGGAQVDADATLLLRALANLLENAAKHGGGVVALRVVKRGTEVAFEVEDAGPGFTGDEVKSIFEPFQRGTQAQPASSQERPGLGLGLSLVQRTAQAHGGHAYAENRPQGGARVGLVVRANTVT